jgi:hypothetical protein
MLIRLIRFWAKKGKDAELLCMNKILNHNSSGGFERAQSWMLTYIVMVYSTWTGTEAEWLCSLERKSYARFSKTA